MSPGHCRIFQEIKRHGLLTSAAIVLVVVFVASWQIYRQISGKDPDGHPTLPQFNYTLLYGHQSAVYSIAFSPDGQHPGLRQRR